MKITSSYGVELRKQNIPIRQTLDVYRSAVSYLVEIYAQVWEELEGILEAKKRFNEAEHLIHTTKKNQARFDFDIRFQKMPSYLRRAAIQHALGSVSSYKTRLGLWEKTGQRESKPKLVYENHAMPVFYRDVMYREDKEGKDAAYLKLYDGHDWKWFHVRLRHTDMEYLRKNWSGKKASAPTLEKRHRKYFLRFSYTEDVILTKAPVEEQIICGVDLGSTPMQSVPLCGRMELSWEESLSTSTVKKTGCTVYWDGYGDSRENMDLHRQRADGLMQNA